MFTSRIRFLRVRRRGVALLAAVALSLGLAAALGVAAPPAHASDYPTCSSTASDPDGDGWGWENDQSCKVVDGVTSGTPGAGDSSDYPTCSSTASDPDGDGWGWENDQSCKVVDGVTSGTPGADGSGGSSTACPSGATCGSYSISGLGARKKQIEAAGGTTLDLAIAMLETDTMTTSYAYGDNKTSDAANFGIFKANWLMIRTACSQFQGESAAQWNDGAALNTDLTADIACRHQSQAYYGIDTWFAGHRDGASGLANPSTADINAYKAAVYWIQAQLESNSASLSNDTRYWVQVPAI